MKTLKFRHYLTESILTKKKYSTWRLFDDKNIKKGDIISLVNWETGKEFGKASVTLVKETKFADLSEEDYKGHEKFNSKSEMFKEYSTYYNQPVDDNTKLKIIQFKLT